MYPRAAYNKRRDARAAAICMGNARPAVVIIRRAIVWRFALKALNNSTKMYLHRNSGEAAAIASWIYLKSHKQCVWKYNSRAARYSGNTTTRTTTARSGFTSTCRDTTRLGSALRSTCRKTSGQATRKASGKTSGKTSACTSGQAAGLTSIRTRESTTDRTLGNATLGLRSGTQRARARSPSRPIAGPDRGLIECSTWRGLKIRIIHGEKMLLAHARAAELISINSITSPLGS